MNNLSQQIAVQDDAHPSQPMAVEDRHFPLILHDILDYSECTGNAHIVSWHPEGCAFQIHIIQKFIQILPLFFRHNNYKSFQRQLNHYAFSRIWDGPEKGCYKHKNFVRGDRKLAIAINPQRGHTYAANQREQSKRHFDGGSLVIKVAKVIEQDSMVKKERYTQQVGNDTVSKKDLLIQYESPPPERPKQKKHKKSVLKQDREGSSENSGDFVPMMQNALCSMPIINQYSDAAPTAGEGGGPAAVPAAELLPSQDFYYTRHGLVLREQQYNRLVPPAAPPDGLSLPSASTTQKQQQQQQQQQQLFNNLEEETAEIVLRQMLWATIGKQQVVGDKGSIQKSINTNTQQKEVDSSCYPQQHAAAPPAPRQGVPPASAAPAAFGEQPTMKQEQVIEDRGRSSSSGWPKPVPLDLLPILDFRVSTYRVQGEGEVVVVGTDSSTVAAVRPPLPVQNESDTTSNEEDGDDESSLSWNLEQTSTILVQPTITRGDEEEQFEQHHTDLLLSCFEDMQEAPRPGARNKRSSSS